MAPIRLSHVPGRIQSIERAAAILRLLSGRARRMGVVELAGQLDLPKATVHGILRTLRDVGFVEQDPESGKYQLGAALLHMGSSYLDGNELRTRALNWSDSLASRSHESVRIGTLHEGRVLVVHHVFRPDDSRQALEVGALLPAHATAIGKALLAESPYVLAELESAGLARFTSATITDPEALRAQLREIHERGWAADFEELVDGEVVLRRRDQGSPRARGRGDRDLRPGRTPVQGRRAAHRARLVRARGRPRGLARSRSNPVVEEMSAQ